MKIISFADTVPDKNLIEGELCKWDTKTIVVIMTVHRACAISVKRELLPVLCLFNVLALLCSIGEKNETIIFFHT